MLNYNNLVCYSFHSVSILNPNYENFPLSSHPINLSNYSFPLCLQFDYCITTLNCSVNKKQFQPLPLCFVQHSAKTSQSNFTPFPSSNRSYSHLADSSYTFLSICNSLLPHSLQILLVMKTNR